MSIHNLLGLDSIPKNRWFVYISTYEKKSFEVLVDNVSNGNILVMDEECLKLECCHRHIEWFAEQVELGKIQLEFWLTPDEMAEKERHLWNFGGDYHATYKAGSFEDMVAQLPEEHRDSAMKWYQFVKKHFKQRGTWPQGMFGNERVYHHKDLKGMRKEDGSYGVDFRNVTSTPAITPVEKATFHGCYGFI